MGNTLRTLVVTFGLVVAAASCAPVGVERSTTARAARQPSAAATCGLDRSSGAGPEAAPPAPTPTRPRRRLVRAACGG